MISSSITITTVDIIVYNKFSVCISGFDLSLAHWEPCRDFNEWVDQLLRLTLPKCITGERTVSNMSCEILDRHVSVEGFINGGDEISITAFYKRF